MEFQEGEGVSVYGGDAGWGKRAWREVERKLGVFGSWR